MTKPTRAHVQPSTSQFETVVKNNIYYWLRRFPWHQNPNVAELTIEKENLIKAIKAGMRFKLTYSLAAHLLFVSTDVMLQIGIRRPWIQLTHTALARCPKDDEYIRGRLFLCQAKQMLLAEQHNEVENLLTYAAESARKNYDADLQWEISYYYGVSCVRNGQYEVANNCIHAVEELLKHCTLLAPHLCRGRIAMLGGEIALTKGEWDKAERYLKYAVHHLRQDGSAHPMALSLDLIGRYYAHKENNKSALSVWEEAIDLIPEGFDFRTRSSLVIRSAGLKLKQGDVQQAEQLLESLDFNLMRLTGSLDIQLQAVLLLSEVAQKKGNDQHAALILENVELLRAELESESSTA